jgi:hypothetical protein
MEVMTIGETDDEAKAGVDAEPAEGETEVETIDLRPFLPVSKAEVQGILQAAFEWITSTDLEIETPWGSIRTKGARLRK